MSFSQTDMLFPIHAVPPAGPLQAGAERRQVRTPDGETLHGVHLPPAAAGGAGTLILGFGGNGWIAVGVGVAVIVVSPFIKKLMHLDTLRDVEDEELAGYKQLGEKQAPGMFPQAETKPSTREF
jgi:hypothetical protein